VSRRSFIKYVGAGLVAATAAGAGYYFYGRQPSPTRIETATSGGWESAAPHPGNNAPIIWAIEMEPKYINPTTETAIRFSHSSSDWDNDPLSTTWLIDWKEVSHEPDHSTKLPEGHHSVTLKVSDGKSQATKYASVTVEPEQIYPTKTLDLKYKGVRYSAGALTPEFPNIVTPSKEEMEEHLDTIRNDLGCNAITIDAGAGYEDNLIECAQLAIEKGFDSIHVQPRYFNATVDETVQNVGRLARRVRELREISDVVVYDLGHEFTLETSGIVPGDGWFERLDYLVKNPDWPKEVEAKFPRMFRDLMAVCNQNYGYKVSYAAIAWCEVDLVPWSDESFESVGVDAYIQPVSGATEDWVVRLLSRLKKHGKPVNSTEAGCLTFSGAGEIGGCVTFGVWEGRQYDEEEQARYIDRYCNMLNKARIDGYFYTQYNDTWDRGYGLYNGKKRKKGFYMYKSYKRTE